MRSLDAVIEYIAEDKVRTYFNGGYYYTAGQSNIDTRFICYAYDVAPHTISKMVDERFEQILEDSRG